MVHNRQFDLTLILENIHDPYNIGAILRSCDAAGIQEVYVLYTEEGLLQNEEIEIGRRTAMGTQKWMDVHLFTDLPACIQAVRSKYQYLYSTHLDAEATTLYELDLRQSVALLFGNEHNGLSRDLLAHSDGNFCIPQFGMSKSLNVSVACAVSVFEAMRQRITAGRYDGNHLKDQTKRASLLADYLRRHESEYDGKVIRKKD